MKKLCRFYCVDCDNSWMEILNTSEENFDYTDKCDYCGEKQEAEHVTSENENQ
jgi:hypothetical protein